MYSQWHSFIFWILEKKPENSDHPQGDRALKCFSFSKQGMKIKGIPRFGEFETTLCIPQDGSLISAYVKVIDRKKDFFEVQFINPSKELLEKLSWWDKDTIEEQISPSPSQSVDIGV